MTCSIPMDRDPRLWFFVAWTSCPCFSFFLFCFSLSFPRKRESSFFLFFFSLSFPRKRESSFSSFLLFFVIPVKAGIQSFSFLLFFVIPAFAGMTKNKKRKKGKKQKEKKEKTWARRPRYEKHSRGRLCYTFFTIPIIPIKLYCFCFYMNNYKKSDFYVMI